jgi:hypothetical protein
MMATTHAAVGLLVAAPLVWLAPELAATGALAGLAGGLFPDLDLVVGVHRKTLHLPEHYPLAALGAVALAATVPTVATVALATFLVAATLHVVTDLLGGSSEQCPWEAVTDRGVYSRLAGDWVAPRRWVRYDGAPEDLLLTVGAGLPAAVLFGSPVDRLAVVGVGVAACYAVVRKRLPQLSNRVNLPVPPVVRVATVAVVLVVRLVRR